MMSTVFLKIINLSYSATWLILAVVVVRLLLKKAPKWISCVLWALVALRLVVPFSFESAMSLLPSSEVIPADIEAETHPHIESGIYAFNSAVNPVMETAMAPAEGSSVNPMQVVVAVACYVWVIGILAMLVYAFISYMKVRRSVREAALLEKGIMECDEVKSPFILGILRPIIYVPSGMDSETRELVLAHERAHIHRRDYIWKPLGFLLLSVYWFNPLSWIAYILLCRDIESACDERVIRNKTADYMAAYSQALLDCSVQRRRIAACPVAFGETGVKMRIKNVLNYKKPAFWIVIASLVACAVVAICFLTNPVRDLEDNTEPEAAEMAESLFDEERTYYYSGNRIDGKDIIDFSITFSPDGSCRWYETPISSYMPFGTYKIENGIITMTKGLEKDLESTYRFEVGENVIRYISEGSDEFGFVKLSDGDEFILGENPLGEYPEVVELDPGVYVWPTDKEVITAQFSLDEEHYHPEVDFAGETGDPVYAVTAGTITETGFDDKDGNYIILEAGDIKITYCHLDEVQVKTGDMVSTGQQIGTLGSTGHSTGPHLAIRLYFMDELQDFLEIYKNRDDQSVSDETGSPFGDIYLARYYNSDKSVYILQDYSDMSSKIVDGDIEIPVEIAMGMYGPSIEKLDIDGDGEDEYIIAECEGTGTGISQYGLCIVEKDGNDYKLTRYDSQYFADYLDEHIGYSYDISSGKFYVYEILPAFVSRWDGIAIEHFDRHDELQDIVWSDIIDIKFEDGKIYLSAPTGYVYEDSPVPDYENAVRVSTEIKINEESGIVFSDFFDFEMDDGEK